MTVVDGRGEWSGREVEVRVGRQKGCGGKRQCEEGGPASCWPVHACDTVLTEPDVVSVNFPANM